MNASVDACRRLSAPCRAPAPAASEGAGTADYPEMPLRCTRHILFALAVLVLASTTHAFAAAADSAVLRVELEPQFAGTAVTPRIGINGTTPAGCMPKIGRVTLDGADLSIELSVSATACKRQRRAPFRLLVDPASSS